jgi:hypothetical protein
LCERVPKDESRKVEQGNLIKKIYLADDRRFIALSLE